MRTQQSKPFLAGLAVLLAGAGPAGTAEISSGYDFFEKRIRPVLVHRCYECHSATAGQSKGGLQLDSRAAWRRGGDSGPVVLPGQPEASRLIQAVSSTDRALEMPPGHHLPAEEIADLIVWVQQGAPDPREEALATRNSKPGASAHWAFQPLQVVAPPSVKNRRWAASPIDRFILARLEAAGTGPSLAAEKRVLLRRTTFDLTGLPPTPEEMDAFLADASTRAFERVVERLLDSRHYGERWGRHWLDLARYADTAGDSSDYPVPQAHKYRDYVIDAFNRDLPYDRFLHEQLAGDLLAGASPARRSERVIATGFIALARRFSVSDERTMHLTIEDTLETLGRSVLGLSLSCARCHDHKHDPVSTREYYAMYGIFSSTRYPFPGSENNHRPADLVPLLPLEQVEERMKPWREQVAAAEAEIARIEQQMEMLHKEGFSTTNLQKEFDAAWKRRDELPEQAPVFDSAYAVAEGQPTNARVQLRGEPTTSGEEVPRGLLRCLGGQDLPSGTSGSGRLELARWLTGPARALTARVMVNRIWHHHFGAGLVTTTSDFGTRGQPPSHPELLDWLAARFMESGWSVKAMQRLILLSATYQQSSDLAYPGSESRASGVASVQASNPAFDPENRLLGRFPRRRLDAEQFRDALLAVSGRLDRTPGGSHPFPPAEKWDFTQHFQFNAVYESERRSVYLMQQRLKRLPFFALFDGADPNVTTGDRTVSTTPLQALFVMNDALVHAQADHFAARVLRERSEDAGRIERAHQLALGRPARPEEQREGVAWLRRLRSASAAPAGGEAAAWAAYARALLGGSEFLFVD